MRSLQCMGRNVILRGSTQLTGILSKSSSPPGSILTERTACGLTEQDPESRAILNFCIKLLPVSLS